jgi:regulatory protein
MSGNHASTRRANAGSGRGDDPEARARQICLRLLTIEPRTRAQLAEALHRRGIPGPVADSVLGRFTDAGLIDDGAFARAWVESRHYSRGLAGRALTAELRQRGVDDEEIREAVAELGPDADVTAARELVTRKLAVTRGQPAQVRMRRLAGMLARKGYPPGLAFRVIREAMEAEGTDADLEEDPPFDDPYFDTE